MDANTSPAMPLFAPYKLGRFDLSHRIVFPALTRNRAHNNIPQQAHATEYYAQTATNGGLLISEAAAASHISQRCPNMPGIWSEEQVEAWKPVVKGVHEKGGVFFCQIWHSGRLSVPTIGGLLFGWLPLATRPADGQVFEKPTPQHLKSDEVPCILNDFRIAAHNAIDAGFDGIEINAASGYLIDQFSIGASSEDRCGLALE
ncbi:12-oxophytodienoate reductase 1 [Datura stramonium]|uniref:12-oxophytodienoate reductase 1 n=1 Tax=Datura stramonium TaxID=4076 RepID=A0ABS8UTC9_DATST|nr:12-oxophytodienoate reductase 1 [Datura stramonium]